MGWKWSGQESRPWVDFLSAKISFAQRHGQQVTFFPSLPNTLIRSSVVVCVIPAGA